MVIDSVNANTTSSKLYADRTENTQGQAVSSADKTKEIAQTESIVQAGTSDVSHDEFIKSGDKPEASAGTYRYETDENGKQKIVFDSPDQSLKSEAAEADESQENNDAQPTEAEGSAVQSEKPAKSDRPQKSGGSNGELKCTVNTDKVDAEIKKLKEEKKQIEQKLKNFNGSEEKRKELETRLTEINTELSVKDSDAYRKQNASTTFE